MTRHRDPEIAAEWIRGAFGWIVILLVAILVVDLKCGDSDSGYVHIREGHEGDWQELVDFGGGGTNWDDLMAFSVGGSLTSPVAGLPVSHGNDKYCYSTPLEIHKSNGDVGVWSPTIIASTNNKLVITAYPTLFDEC